MSFFCTPESEQIVHIECTLGEFPKSLESWRSGPLRGRWASSLSLRC